LVPYTSKGILKVVITKIKIRLIYSLAKIFCKISPSYHHTFTLNDGLTFYYPLNSGVGRALLAGIFEVYELNFLRKFLKQGDVVLDVGANGGLYTVIAAQRVGKEGHIYACEPSQRELNLLQHNIKSNSLENVTIIKSAVSSEEGTVKFGIAQDGAMNSLAVTDHPGQSVNQWENVELTTIDNIISLYKLTKINLIKIDVEGAEKLVIDGAQNLLQSEDSPVLLLEASNLNSQSFGYSAKQILQQLLNYGYKVYYFNPEKNGSLTPISLDDRRIGHQIYNFVISKQEYSMDCF
jgi:FkbM family methyltransferase